MKKSRRKVSSKRLSTLKRASLAPAYGKRTITREDLAFGVVNPKDVQRLLLQQTGMVLGRTVSIPERKVVRFTKRRVRYRPLPFVRKLSAKDPELRAVFKKSYTQGAAAASGQRLLESLKLGLL